jgi:hypothetical protein
VLGPAVRKGFLGHVQGKWGLVISRGKKGDGTFVKAKEGKVPEHSRREVRKSLSLSC